MPWCHNCNVEYEEKTEQCAKCGAPLLSEAPPEAAGVGGEWANRDMAHLVSTDSQVEADNIQNCLRAENISVVWRPRDKGLRGGSIVMGYAAQGADLFVPPERLEAAQKVLDELGIVLGDDKLVKAVDDEPEDEDSDELDRLGIQYRRKVRTGFILILVIVLLMLFLHNLGGLPF